MEKVYFLMSRLEGISRRGECLHSLFLLFFSFFFPAFLVVFRSDAVYDLCIWHTCWAMKSSEKQKGQQRSDSHTSQPGWCVLCNLMICFLKYQISSWAFNYLEVSTKIPKNHITCSGKAENLAGGKLTKGKIETQEIWLRNLFSKFSYIAGI